MSKSSKRRLARAAILNAQPTTAAKSLLQAASSQRGTGTRVEESPGRPGVPLPCSPALNSEISKLKSPSESASAPSLLNSQLSTLNSSPDCNFAPSSSFEISNLKSEIAAPSSPPAAPASPRTGKTLQQILASPPSEFFKTHLEPHCPGYNLKPVLHPALPPHPVNPLDPIDSNFADYRAKISTIFKKLSPDDPDTERLLHNYTIVLHIATVERLISALPGLSESAQLETNNQIIRMLSIIERTHSRRARELREKDAAARRIIREQKRKERQAQKESEKIARDQRNKDREEQRRQREQAKADRAQQKHELAMRKLDLKERDLTMRESQKQEKLEHRNATKPTESSAPAPTQPMRPHNEWTCG